MQFAFLLVQVLDQTPPSLLHLAQSTFQSIPVGCPSSCLSEIWHIISPILGLPHSVSNEFIKSYLPVILEVLIWQTTDWVHKSFHIFYEDIVSCNQYFLLLLLLAATFWYLALGLRSRAQTAILLIHLVVMAHWLVLRSRHLVLGNLLNRPQVGCERSVLGLGVLERFSSRSLWSYLTWRAFHELLSMGVNERFRFFFWV